MAETVRRKSRYATYNNACDGSAARKLEQHASTGVEVRPRRRVVARPKIRVREAGQVSVFAVAGFLAVGICAILLLLCYIELASVSDEVVALRGQLDGLKEEGAELRAQYELAYDLNNLEKTLTQSGKMIRPQNGQIFYIDLSEPDSVVRFDEEPAQGAGGALESVKQLIASILAYFQPDGV